MGKHSAGWKSLKERPRTTRMDRSVEKDLASLNVSLHLELRKARNRIGWPLQPRPPFGLEFASDNDDSEHRLK